MSSDPVSGLATDLLATDLQAALATLLETANVCRLFTLADLDDCVPARPLSRPEAEAFLAALADNGLHLIEPGAVMRLMNPRRTNAA